MGWFMNKGKTATTLIVIFLIIAVVIGGVFLAYNNKDDSPDYAAIIASMEKEINKNVETITELEQTLELNGLKLEDLTKTIVEYETIIDDRTKIQKEYIERKQYITRTLTDKQTIYRTKTETKTKIEKEIETLAAELEKTQEENPSDVEKITEIQEKIVEKEKEKVVIEKEIQEIEKVIIEYEKELVEVEERINVLTININQLNEMITELNVSINLIGKTEEETRALLKSIEDENAALSEEIAYIKAENENIKANLENKYQNIIDNLNNDISVLNARISKLQSDLNTSVNENISLKQTIINLENEIEILNKNINGYIFFNSFYINDLFNIDDNSIGVTFDFYQYNDELWALELKNNQFGGLPIYYLEKKDGSLDEMVILRHKNSNKIIVVVADFYDISTIRFFHLSMELNYKDGFYIVDNFDKTTEEIAISNKMAEFFRDYNSIADCQFSISNYLTNTDYELVTLIYI